MTGATERFVEVLSTLLPQMTEHQRVRLEEAFNEAVEARVEQREREARREEW